jgi:hypothetical protein
MRGSALIIRVLPRECPYLLPKQKAFWWNFSIDLDRSASTFHFPGVDGEDKFFEVAFF